MPPPDPEHYPKRPGYPRAGQANRAGHAAAGPAEVRAKPITFQPGPSLDHQAWSLHSNLPM